MGWRRTARLTIKVYGETEASISVSGEIQDGWEDWIYIIHLAKTLYTLGDQGAAWLLHRVSSFADKLRESPEKTVDIARGKPRPSSLGKLVRVVPDRTVGHVFTIDVLSKRGEMPIIQTELPPGGSYRQIALTNLLLLDFLIGRRPLPAVLILPYLHAMLGYYQNVGSWRDTNSVMQAPTFAVGVVANAAQS